MRIRNGKSGTRCILILVLTGFLLTGCQRKEQQDAQRGEQEINTSVVTFQLTPSSDGVADFLQILGIYEEEYDSDHCYNVTPQEISDKYAFRIFKFDKSCCSFLLYGDEVYPLGEWFGGYGVTSFAVADLNGDGAFELYFTYSWGSGIPRSQVGCFDTATKETTIFDFVNWLAESVLGTDSDQALCVYHADSHVNSFVDIEMTAEDKIAWITADAGKISLTDERQSEQEDETPEKTHTSILSISPKGEEIKWAIYSEGYYCYGNGSFCGFVSEEGEEITPCIYTEAAPFSEGLACVCLDGKYGYIGKNGETVLPFIYDQAASFSEGTAYFSRGDECGLMDREGNVVLELTDCDSISSFREGLAYFSVDGQYGYMDKSGRIVIQPIYDDAGYFYDGRAVVMKDGFGGIVGKDGKEILPTEYIGVSTEDDCITAQKEDAFYVFDNQGNEVSSGTWDRISDGGKNIFYIYQNDRIGFLDKSGKIIMEPVYEYVTPIPERELVIVRNEAGSYGVLDYAGEIKVPFRYSEISYQEDAGGLRVTDAETGKAGYLDGDDYSEKIPAIYDSLQYFTEDRAVARLGEKYGVVRYDGTLAVPVAYDSILLFSDGAMAVWNGETVDLTDREGHLILKGVYTNIWKCGEGYGTSSEGGSCSYWDSQGRLAAQFDTFWSEPVYGAKNSTLRGGTLLRCGEEEGACPEEYILTNQITPRAGLFLEFLKGGSIAADTGGPEFTSEIARLPQGRRFSKLYRMGEEAVSVLYFYADPLEQSNFAMSDSGWFLIRDGQVEQIAGANECGGSLRGDWACCWYDKEEKTWKPGTSGIWGGWPGYADTEEIYCLENGKGVLEASFTYYYELLGDEEEENYYVNGDAVSEEAYYTARGRYRYYMPLDLR